MKRVMVILLLFGFTVSSFSQEKPVKDEGSMEITNLPEIVIIKAEKDFSGYIHHDNPDADVRKIQDEFTAYNIGTDYEGYGEYLVIMKMKKGSLVATYNENGKLTRVVENYKNISLPSNVLASVYRSFPQWTLDNSKLDLYQANGDLLINQYNLKIKKDKEFKTVLVNPNGDILKVR